MSRKTPEWVGRLIGKAINANPNDVRRVVAWLYEFWYVRSGDVRRLGTGMRAQARLLPVVVRFCQVQRHEVREEWRVLA